MRVFLIAAVLAVFATPTVATAKCGPSAARHIEQNGMDPIACRCIVREVVAHMRIYFAIDPLGLPDRDLSTPQLTENSQKALDNANKLANIHAAMCRFASK